jgi:RNA polymerase sigma-70 factor (ECF subfamily)
MDEPFAASDECPGRSAPTRRRPVASAAWPFQIQPISMSVATTSAEADGVGGPDPSAWIVAIAAHGDRQCFALLFVRFAPRVKSYLLKLGCRPDQAEELAQETLLVVWRKAAYYDPGRASASTWIFTIARNLRIDAIRRERHPEDFADEPEMLPAAPAAADETLSAAERDARIRNAMGSLSAEQAEVVRQSFFQDKAHGEISRDLGLPLGTVKSRLRLALDRLRAQLGDLL